MTNWRNAGDLAVKVAKRAIEAREAAAAMERADRPVAQGEALNGFVAADHREGSDQPPMRRGEEPRAMGMKDRGPEAPVSALEDNHSEDKAPRTVLFPPTIGRDMATAHRGAEPHGSAVVISLAMWKRDHPVAASS